MRRPPPIDLDAARRERRAAPDPDARFSGLTTVRTDERLRAQLAGLRRLLPEASEEALIRLAVAQLLGELAQLESACDTPALEQVAEIARGYETPARASGGRRDDPSR